MDRRCAGCTWIRSLVAGLTACTLIGSPPHAAGQAPEDDTPAVTRRLLPADVAWTLDLGVGPRHPPAWDGTRAYVALRNGSLAAVELLTGEIRWSVEQIADQPPVAGEELVMAAGGAELTARRAQDGFPLWTRSFASPIAGPLYFGAGWLIAGTADGDLVALRALDGAEMWRQRLGATPTVSPSAAGDRLYVPLDDGQVVALALDTGALLWARRLTGQPQGILPLDALFVGSADHHFYRLGLADGEHDWYWRAGGDIVGTPAIDAARVYFTARDNVLRALDRWNGARRWRTFLEHRPTSGPIRTGSLLMVTGVSESALFFDAETGAPAGHYDAPADLAAPPYVIPPPADPPVPVSVMPRLALITTDGRLVTLTEPMGPTRLSMTFPPHPLLPLPDRLDPALMTEWHPVRLPLPPMQQ